jgi:formylglycine-generating enzyme
MLASGKDVEPPTPMTDAPLLDETAKAAGGRALAPGLVWIPAGTFLMGSDSHYPEEAPAHKVSIDGFWIDRFTVTNREFARFVAKTGHVTVAAGQPSFLVCARLEGCSQLP